MTKRRWTSLGFLFLYLFTFNFTFFPAPAKAGQQEPVIMGYYSKDWYTDNDSYNSLTKYHKYLDYVATFAARMDSNGELIIDYLPSEGISQAKKLGVKPLLVVHNMYNGTFDSWSAGAVLGDPNKRWEFAKNIAWLVKKHGYSGVNIDIEAVPPKNRNDYNSFLWELKGLLKSGDYILTAAIPAKNADQKENKWAGAYNYKEIGKVCDYVMLMTYDEHWFGGTPGAIASLPWVQSVLNYTVSQMPSKKVLLGLAAYGYDWSYGKTGAVKWKDIDTLVKNTGAEVVWDSASNTPHFFYWKGTEKHEVWFENKYSLGIKLGLVKSYKLAGVGVWRMGFEDSTFWDTINRKL